MKSFEDIANYLFANRAKALPPRALAEVFDRLIWCLDNDGGEILKIQREWLSCQDVEKVKIALAMTEVFPFESRDQMNDILASISAKWPELRVKCERFAEPWRR